MSKILGGILSLSYTDASEGKSPSCNLRGHCAQQDRKNESSFLTMINDDESTDDSDRGPTMDNDVDEFFSSFYADSVNGKNPLRPEKATKEILNIFTFWDEVTYANETGVNFFIYLLKIAFPTG